jgi:dipeptidyl aminopeptidase/acylaminoacyl peptidase
MTAPSHPGRHLLAAALLTGALAPAAALAEEAVQISPSRKGNCENPLWSRDGKGLAYERVFYEERRIELNLVRDVHATKVKEERVKPVLESRDESAATLEAFQSGAKKKVAPGEVCREFAWGPKDSPNTFVYSCNVEGSSYQLFMTEGEQLTRGDGAAGQPNMTVDGWGLVYVSSNQEREGLFVIHDLIDEIRPLRLLPPGTRVDRMPVWSPSGKKIAFVGHDKDSADIYVIENVRNSEESMVRLTKWSSEESNPSWSPDGTKIAFFSDHDGPKKKAKPAKKGRGSAGQALYVVDLAKGGEPFLVARDVVPSEQHGPAWTPDSQWLVYAKDYQKGQVIDPIRAVRAEPDAKEMMLKTGTVSNKDPQVVEREGRWWMAFSALGRYKGKERTWRKVYVMPIEKVLTNKEKPEEE